MSHLCVLDDGTSEELFSHEFVPHFPGCGRSRGWCAAGPQLRGAAGRWRALRGVTARSGKGLRERRAESRAVCPALCSPCWAVRSLEGAVEMAGVVAVTETSPVRLPISPLSLFT